MQGITRLLSHRGPLSRLQELRMLVQNLFRGSYAYETICQVRRLSSALSPRPAPPPVQSRPISLHSILS